MLPLSGAEILLALPLVRSFGLVFPILTSIFITSSSLVATYVSVKAFLREGVLAVLLLGCGALVFGISCIVASALWGTEGLEFSGAVFALGALVSGVFHLGCASSSYRGRKQLDRPAGIAVATLSAAVLLIALSLATALTRATPPFFEQGFGTTLLGQVTLGLAGGAFAAAFVLISAVSRSNNSRVLYWYSLSLAATVAGIFGVVVSGGDILSIAMRLGWGALFVGGLFLLASLLSAESAADINSMNR